MNKKELYAAPASEVLELRLEGVIATVSGNLEDWEEIVVPGGWGS